MNSAISLLTEQLVLMKQIKTSIANAKTIDYDALIQEYEEAIALLKGV